MEHNPPAFPTIPIDEIRRSHPYSQMSEGMTLRDYFAAKAMQAYLSCKTEHLTSFDEIADLSYKAADAMLAERMKSNQPEGDGA